MSAQNLKKGGKINSRCKGGSLASDAVVNLVSSTTAAKMNATNQFGGNIGAIRVYNSAGGAGGVVSCDTTPVYTTIVQPPTSMATANMSALPYDQIAHSVLTSLGAQAADGSLMQNNISYPPAWTSLDVFAADPTVRQFGVANL
jgi:hypothetical protein